MNQRALLIIGHGSKSRDAVDVFEKIVEATAERKTYARVMGAHMELAVPSIEEASDILYKEGFKEVVVVPYFLFEGNHIKFDIPEIFLNIQKTYPDLNFTLAKPIGFEPSMVDILLRRAKETE